MLKIKRLRVGKWSRGKTRHCIFSAPFLFCLPTRRFHLIEVGRSTGDGKCLSSEAKRREAKPDTGRCV